MKKIIFIYALLTNLIFSQGFYLSTENSFSVGVNYGKYPSSNKLGFGATYTFKGLLDFSYNRSTIFTDKNDNNYHNEYFLRVYILKGNIFFISFGTGYLTQYAKTELWKNFSLELESDEFAFEFGFHLKSKIDESKYFVASVFYKYFNPTENFTTPTAKWEETNLTRSIIFDFGFILSFNQFAFEIGPRINVEIDRGDSFFGLNLIAMLKH